ncbi:hypothetical protein ISS40_01045 [Candidatus Bathyarchaeota archaeon]|nr:hypothetical protein [Candidatus Bathyarchaeota archaeon]
MKSKKGKSIFGLIIVVLLLPSIMLLSSLNTKEKGTDEETRYLYPSFPAFSKISKKVDLGDLDKAIDFDVKIPPVLGVPDEVLVEQGNERVWIIYTMSKIDDHQLLQFLNSSDSEVLIRNAGGIVLTVWKHNMTYEESVNVTESAIIATEGKLERVNINGYVGSMGGDDAHLIYWSTESTWYKLSAGVKEDYSNLLEIARNIDMKRVTQ